MVCPFWLTFFKSSVCTLYVHVYLSTYLFIRLRRYFLRTILTFLRIIGTDRSIFSWKKQRKGITVGCQFAINTDSRLKGKHIKFLYYYHHHHYYYYCYCYYYYCYFTLWLFFFFSFPIQAFVVMRFKWIKNIEWYFGAKNRHFKVKAVHFPKWINSHT